MEVKLLAIEAWTLTETRLFHYVHDPATSFPWIPALGDRGHA